MSHLLTKKASTMPLIKSKEFGNRRQFLHGTLLLSYGVSCTAAEEEDVIRRFVTRIAALSRFSSIFFESSRETRFGDTVSKNTRKRMLTVGASRMRLDIFPDRGSDPIVRIQTPEHVKVYAPELNSYVESDVGSPITAYDREVIAMYRDSCFGRFALLRSAGVKLDPIRQTQKTVGGSKLTLNTIAFRFNDGTRKGKCAVSVNTANDNPIHCSTEMLFDGKSVSEQIDFRSIETGESDVNALLNWTVPITAKRVEAFRGRLPQ